MSLTHRENTVFSTTTNGYLTPATTGAVIAYAPGGIVAQTSTGDQITLYGGHGFVGGEKFMRGIDSSTFSGIYTVASVAGNVLTLTPSGGSYSVDSGDRLINLGADNGNASPNFDGSTVVVYSTPDTTTVIDDSRVSLSETGGYEYWHQGLALWELVVGGDGLPVGVNVDVAQGEVVGPDTSTDNAIVRWDGTNGLTIQDSPVIVDDAGAITGITTATSTAIITDDLTVNDDAIVTGDLTVVGNIVGPASVSGNATVSGTLGVTGVTTLTGALHADGNVINTANTTVATLAVGGALTASAAILEAAIGTMTGTHGQTFVRGFAEELLTLSTGGTTTDTVGTILQANSLILAVTGRVTTTVTTATDWSLGISGTATRFASANATMTANSTSIGLNHWKGGVSTEATGPTQTAAASVRVTTTGTPGAGVIRISVFYLQFTAPTS